MLVVQTTVEIIQQCDIVLIVLVLVSISPKQKEGFVLVLNVTVNKWQVLIYQNSACGLDRGRSIRLHNSKLIRDLRHNYFMRRV